MTYFRNTATELPHEVGENLRDGSRGSDGRAGYMCYGPYIDLKPGIYYAGFYLQVLSAIDSEDKILIDVVHTSAQVAQATRIVRSSDAPKGFFSLVTVDFHLDEAVKRLEVRLHVGRSCRLLQRDLVIFQDETL